MKRILSTLILVAFAAVASFAQGKPATFKFQEKNDTYNFGTVKEAGEIEHVFEYTNTGGVPLIIQSVEASCGCTTPDWSREPVLPGKKGKITVKYNTKGRVGPFNKSIYIKSNATVPNGQDRYELKITGEVKPK